MKIKAVYRITGEFLEINVEVDTFDDKPIMVRYKGNEMVWHYETFAELFDAWYFIQDSKHFEEVY